ncbi:MAG: CAP domain-containing protein [bacterium]|nr:CAP domain-containing protein [bacterium]
MRSKLIVAVATGLMLLTLACRSEAKKEAAVAGATVEPVPTATVVVLPTATPAPPANPADQLFLLLNEQRMRTGRNALRLDPTLSIVAQYRAEDMALNHYFGHAPPDGCNFVCLMDQARIGHAWAGENLAWNNWPIEGTATRAAKMLWESLPHRANTLNPHYERIGIGVVIAESGRYTYAVIYEGSLP